MEQRQCEVLFDYFNRDLSEKEQLAFEKHLKVCADCQEELAELQIMTEDLPYVSEAIEPNDGMKDRVLTAVFSETNAEKTEEKGVEKQDRVTEKQLSKQPKRWLQPLLAASLLISLGTNTYLLLADKPETKEVTTASPIEDVQLAAAEGFSGSARATMVEEERSSTVIIQAEQLKGLSGKEAYQVWLIDESGNKVRAGTFRPNDRGSGAVSHAMPEPEGGAWQMIAVTLEPTPESTQPLGEIVLAAEL